MLRKQLSLASLIIIFLTANAGKTSQALSSSLIPCVGGTAGIYPCHNVDLLAQLPLSALGGGSGSDSWGWTDSQTGKEYALMGRSNGTAFVDISDPTSPVYLGNLPSYASTSFWRDIKVYKDHAYIVASFAGNHGMQVFDLTQLRNVNNPPVTFVETAHYAGTAAHPLLESHNIVINEASGFAYGVGDDNGCSSGLHVINIQNPVNPVFASCFSQDGYTHDAQCVNYHGPDADYAGHEICFNANEDTLTIVDITNKNAPVQLARVGNSNFRYTHQGWLTEEHQYFIANDEEDEIKLGVKTRTFVWDVSDLSQPKVNGFYEGSTPAIDHNLYIKGNLIYEANYTAGLQILSMDNLAQAELSEIAYFDTYPSSNSTTFDGAWNVYPFFASGTIMVSDFDRGLFLLRYHENSDLGEKVFLPMIQN